MTKPGLRERKKAETRLAIADVATSLFIERGFDRVTIAEVAEAANVSVNTIFNYFAAKEDLFFDRAEEVVDAPSRMVRDRKEGEPVLHALRRGFHEALKGGGLFLASGKSVQRFFAALEASPALKAKERLFAIESEQRLARTLSEAMNASASDPTPAVLASMVVALSSTIALDLRARTSRDEPEAKARAAARRLCDRGFEILLAGLET
jgi:AcrR family transcriptional regulator